MLTKPIPSSGESWPVIGLGICRSFDIRLTRGKPKEPQKVLKLFFAAGGKVIDSSPMCGEAEDVTGDIMASIDGRDQAFLANTVWTWARQRGIAEMDNSLRLLRCSAIELIQIHNLIDCNTYLATLPL